MSKIISFRGQVAIGIEEKLKLSTLDGKTGYKIIKFQIIPFRPGVTSVELISKIYNKSQTGNETSTVDFTEGDLLAANYYQDNNADAYPSASDVIFDNSVTNQDIFVYVMCALGSTQPANYYIELEAFPINDVEATQLTLQSVRTITSR